MGIHVTSLLWYCYWLVVVTPWTVACQAPLSMGFSRQEYWTGLPFPIPSNPHPLCLLHWQADSLPLCHLRSTVSYGTENKMQTHSHGIRGFTLIYLLKFILLHLAHSSSATLALFQIFEPCKALYDITFLTRGLSVWIFSLSPPSILYITVCAHLSVLSLNVTISHKPF